MKQTEKEFQKKHHPRCLGFICTCEVLFDQDFRLAKLDYEAENPGVDLQASCAGVLQ